MSQKEMEKDFRMCHIGNYSRVNICVIEKHSMNKLSDVKVIEAAAISMFTGVPTAIL